MRHYCYFCDRRLKSTKDRRKHTRTAGHLKRKSKWFERYFHRHPGALQQALAKCKPLDDTRKEYPMETDASAQVTAEKTES